MRVLLDSNVPRTFAALLPGRVVQTAQQRRWGDLDDRPLLDACEAAGFEGFVTADQNLRFQQNLAGRRVRILVLRAARTSLPSLAPLAPLVLRALREMQPGELRVLAANDR